MDFLDEQRWRGNIFTGDWHRSADGAVRSVREPATGVQLGVVGIAGSADLERSTAHAREAQVAWAARPVHERVSVLRRAAQGWARHRTDIENWVIRESGTVRHAAAGEVRGALDECLAAALLPAHPLGEVLPSEHALLSMTRRVPVGVLGVLTPADLPVTLAIRYVAPALALGNAVILKPDPRTAVSGGVILARVFEEAGLPAGVLHVLPGGAELGAAIVRHADVRAVSFAGTTETGRAVNELAARDFTRIRLDLRGNRELIVLPDADLDRAVGTASLVPGRHLVHESVYDGYLRRLAERTARLTVGDPATGDVALGPVIDEEHRDRIHSYVTESVAAGAKLLTGGSYDGLFYRPTVLADTGPGAPAYENEVAGPVASVARFATVDEAAILASDTRYGLSLGIFTADVAAGLALAERIPTATAHINDHPRGGGISAPSGGPRDAATAIEAYTTLRWITAQPSGPAS